jgi:CTP synthase
MVPSGEPLILPIPGAVVHLRINSGKILFFVVAKSPAYGFCWTPVGGHCLQPQRSRFMTEKKSIKHIFVTGGVVSSLGKGLTAAALGALLEQRGLKIKLQKFDPYLNVDPGTMNPFQHGEVYVLDDGSETDLDLGHYERFTSGKLSYDNNLTSGQIYDNILKRERRGDFLGQTIQVIPHVTNEIQSRFEANATDEDVIITEIGGTVGDIEGLPFLEAMRQFSLDRGRQDVMFLHVTLVPYLAAAGELKTKPTQQSVARLREIGIQPDVLVCRTEKTMARDLRQKLSMFCNVPVNAVIEEKDVETSIYEVPLMLENEGMDQLVLKHFGLDHLPQLENGWDEVVRILRYPKHRVEIAVVGKYIELQDAYKSVYESLVHGGIANDCAVEIHRIDSEKLEESKNYEALLSADGILVPGGFGSRGIEGKIEAVRIARENGIPYFGLCLGMQVAVIEFARNVATMKGAHSGEFDEGTEFPVIDLMPEQKDVEDKGATMRLGAYPCKLADGTISRKAYGSELVSERHRHRYEFNNDFQGKLEEAGLVVAGVNPDRHLVEIVENPKHPWFVGVQFHPEFQSKPRKSHPLFASFIEAALSRRNK